MPRITFIEDVILPNEKEGTGPHYRRGYSPDVSEDEARKWVRAGKAVMGEVDMIRYHGLSPKKIEEPEAKRLKSEWDKAYSEPATSRKKRWRSPE